MRKLLQKELEFCNPFVYPTPFGLHFSAAHLKWFQENPDDYVKKMNGTDKDLAAHFTIINHCGVVFMVLQLRIFLMKSV